jgi:hydroxymethylbilane synthase
MQKKEIIKIGTRGSKLALAQSYIVQGLLKKHHPHIESIIIPIKTTGDKILEKDLNEIGGKGLFIKEIQEQLLDRSIDIAVHSMKDMPAINHDKLEICCILEREDPRDAILSSKATSIELLPKGSLVGTSSPRRAAQILHKRPDLKIISFRGNIQTRIQKLADNKADATFLAMAGINRCNIQDNIITAIDTDIMLPAVGQGAIGVEILRDNIYLKEILLPLDHKNTHIEVKTERAFLREFEGSCRTPIASLAKIQNNQLIDILYLIASPDGKTIHRASRLGPIHKANQMSVDAALELKEKIDSKFFT